MGRRTVQVSQEMTDRGKKTQKFASWTLPTHPPRTALWLLVFGRVNKIHVFCRTASRLPSYESRKESSYSSRLEESFLVFATIIRVRQTKHRILFSYVLFRDDKKEHFHENEQRSALSIFSSSQWNLSKSSYEYHYKIRNDELSSFDHQNYRTSILFV